MVQRAHVKTKHLGKAEAGSAHRAWLRDSPWGSAAMSTVLLLIPWMQPAGPVSRTLDHTMCTTLSQVFSAYHCSAGLSPGCPGRS